MPPSVEVAAAASVQGPALLLEEGRFSSRRTSQEVGNHPDECETLESPHLGQACTALMPSGSRQRQFYVNLIFLGDGAGAGNSFFVASGANDDKKRAAMERIKAFNDLQAKKRSASGIPAPAPPLVADPSAVEGQLVGVGEEPKANLYMSKY